MPHLLLLLLLGCCCLAFPQPCSVDNNITCDSMGNATLDTAAFHDKYEHCDWTSIDKDDTVLELLTPSPNVNVQCSLPEIRLKVHCISPEYVELLACYKIGNNIEPGTPSRAGEILHQSQVAVFVPVCLWCWMYLL
ncbi:hypothetical protein PHYPO_G00009110 [Pangasianodon hypophthalmus]|uniref:Uncharacterized protein n=1 Tax=Pangasianodon hypophthalmus TaxID=310915 RepID=A0A5N5Q740_PANHP|nr:hypothetical protein PHYPO_G00009110 [Pangasianodon hypophthalmus]